MSNFFDDDGENLSHTYDTQQVCLNGHQVTPTYNGTPVDRRSYCAQCGAGTIHQCPECRSELKGEPRGGGILVAGRTLVPEFCASCGKSLPWTGKRAGEQRAAAGWGPPELVIERLLGHFHVFARQLRARHDGRQTLDIDDEYDVQDALHALLRIFFDDVRPEEVTPSYAGGSARMDFLLKAEQLVLEVKKTRKGLGPKEVGDQLLVDIGRYKAHPDCKRLVCFVYDPDGRITNAAGMERDLTRKHGDMDVTVFIWPKA